MRLRGVDVEGCEEVREGTSRPMSPWRCFSHVQYALLHVFVQLVDFTFLRFRLRVAVLGGDLPRPGGDSGAFDRICI